MDPDALVCEGSACAEDLGPSVEELLETVGDAGYFYWLVNLIWSYVVLPSRWIFIIGCLWYFVGRYCTRLFSRQQAFPSGSYGENVIPGWLERTHQKSVVWAVQRLKESLKYDTKMIDIGFGSGSSFVTSLRLMEESFSAESGKDSDLKATYSIVGIERSVEMIEYCRTKFSSEIDSKRIVLRQGDALNLEFDENSFDVIIVFNVIQLIKDKQKAIEGWLKCLKSGGTLGILFQESEEYIRDPFVQAGILQGFMHLPHKNYIVELLQKEFNMIDVQAIKRETKDDDEDINMGDVLIMAKMPKKHKHITLSYE
mmetsp:Transcript_8912/g.10189  ORF Transcript_8912/g.10189 Transcript_8912/m.10189 type:complete len:312 (+) Transcript_8912:168-1103(+)